VIYIGGCRLRKTGNLLFCTWKIFYLEKWYTRRIKLGPDLILGERHILSLLDQTVRHWL